MRCYRKMLRISLKDHATNKEACAEIQQAIRPREDFLSIVSLISQISLNRKGSWGTTDDFSTSFLHFFLFSTALWDLANSRPVHPWCCLPTSSSVCLVFFPFTVPCKMVLARPDERETWPYHCSLCLFTMVRRSSCDPDPRCAFEERQTNWQRVILQEKGKTHFWT